MKTEYSTFDRRMEILSILMNQKLNSRLELGRRFSVSDVTIGEDITVLSRFALITETINASSLSAFVKEQMSENDEILPDWLDGKANVFDKVTVSLRKSK